MTNIILRIIGFMFGLAVGVVVGGVLIFLVHDSVAHMTPTPDNIFLDCTTSRNVGSGWSYVETTCYGVAGWFKALELIVFLCFTLYMGKLFSGSPDKSPQQINYEQNRQKHDSYLENHNTNTTGSSQVGNLELTRQENSVEYDLETCPDYAESQSTRAIRRYNCYVCKNRFDGGFKCPKCGKYYCQNCSTEAEENCLNCSSMLEKLT